MKLVAGFFLCLSLALRAQTAPPKDLNAGFTGRWVGQLEYRDFQSNEQVFLPTWLTVTEAPATQAAPSALAFQYIYDDVPTKTVTELMTIALDPGASKISFNSDRDHTADIYSVAGMAELSKIGRGTLIFNGPGKENDKPVDVRITLTLRRNLLTLRKETRPANGEFKFRDGYTFASADPPNVTPAKP